MDVPSVPRDCAAVNKTALPGTPEGAPLVTAVRFSADTRCTAETMPAFDHSMAVERAQPQRPCKPQHQVEAAEVSIDDEGSPGAPRVDEEDPCSRPDLALRVAGSSRGPVSRSRKTSGRSLDALKGFVRTKCSSSTRGRG